MQFDSERVLTKFVLLWLSVDLAHANFADDDVTLRPYLNYGKITMEKHLKNHGVATGRHQILTEDGYYLTLFNFFFQEDLDRHDKTPVLLVHGLTCDCSCWFVGDIKKSLPYYLLVQKNDVWCVNLRGTRSSRRHLRYSVNSADYWNFSFHENGVYDLPPVVDYVIDHTKHPKIVGFGHSSGATAFMVLLSKNPEYNGKLEHVVVYGAASVLRSIDNPLLLLAFNTLPYIKWIDRIIYRFPPVGTHEFLWRFCTSGFFTSVFCTNFISLFFGYSPEQCDYRVTNTLLSGAPTPIPMKQMVHYSLVRKSGNFSEYDYGFEQNMKLYGIPHPKHYNTGNISTPFSIVYSYNDWLTTPRDNIFTYSLLPNAQLYRIPCKYFNHADLIIGKSAWKCAYEEITRIINTHSG